MSNQVNHYTRKIALQVPKYALALIDQTIFSTIFIVINPSPTNHNFFNVFKTLNMDNWLVIKTTSKSES